MCLARGIDERQESCGPQWAALQPATEHINFAGAWMQMLGQFQQAATIAISCAGQHDSQTCHEETGPHPRPSFRFEVTRQAEVNESFFVIPIELCGKVTVRCGIRESDLHDVGLQSSGPLRPLDCK